MSQVSRAVEILRKGGLIGLPTETVYGLAGSILHDDALRSIFALKERPFFDPLIVHIGTLEQRSSVVREWPTVAQALAESFWPGPLTLVLPKHAAVNPLVTSGLDTVALRMPQHAVALEVLRALGEPLAAPSANKFGKTSPTSAEHVRQSFGDLFVLEGGPAQVGVESTVLAVEERALRILRPGAITQEMLQDFIKRNSFELRLERAESQASPGHLEHHYQPDLPLLLLDLPKGANLLPPAEVQTLAQQILGVGPRAKQVELSDDPLLAARELYAKLREASLGEADFLYIFRRAHQVGGLWEAVQDRLQRAAVRVLRI